MNTAQNVVSHRQPISLRSRSRLTFNEQLCLFAPGNEVSSTQASFGWGAALGILLAVVPWVLFGFMIWMFA